MQEKNTEQMFYPDNFEHKNRSIKKAVAIVVLLMAALAAAGFFVYFNQSFKNRDNAGGEKIELMKRLDYIEKSGILLSEKEKMEISKNLMGDKMQEFNLSNEEKIKLLKALNKK